MTAILINDASKRYFVELSTKTLGKNLLSILQTDSYLRQPCYSARAREHYYFILDNFTEHTLFYIRYLQGEFPDFIINYLSKDELEIYPSHAKWQFIFAPKLYQVKDSKTMSISREEQKQALSYSIINVGHIARIYYLRELDDKNYTWAIRQLGWAIKYAENGILKLWNYFKTGQYASSLLNSSIDTDLKWLIKTNENWFYAENELLASSESYQDAVLTLNRITQFFSEALAQEIGSQFNLEEDVDYAHANSQFNFIEEIKSELINYFNSNIQAFYLSGSVARGEQHASSDIDSIAVFEKLDDNILHQVRSFLRENPKLTIYSLSLTDVMIYPRVKYYTLSLGIKRLLGKLTFDHNLLTKSDVKESILNNLFCILQIARSYLITENYGPRAIAIIYLMLKLSDHGCMRLFFYYFKGYYPDKKYEIMEYFNNDAASKKILNLLTLNDKLAEKMRKALWENNKKSVSDIFILLIDFVNEFHEKLTSLKR